MKKIIKLSKYFVLTIFTIPFVYFISLILGNGIKEASADVPINTTSPTTPDSQFTQNNPIYDYNPGGGCDSGGADGGSGCDGGW